MSRAAYGSTLVLVASLVLARPLAAQSKMPDKSTGRCGDGTWTMAASQRGACSAHQGVKKWIGKKPRGATARCNDGEYWANATAQGACSGHEGVLLWYKKPAGGKK